MPKTKKTLAQEIADLQDGHRSSKSSSSSDDIQQSQAIPTGLDLGSDGSDRKRKRSKKAKEESKRPSKQQKLSSSSTTTQPVQSTLSFAPIKKSKKDDTLLVEIDSQDLTESRSEDSESDSMASFISEDDEDALPIEEVFDQLFDKKFAEIEKRIFAVVDDAVAQQFNKPKFSQFSVHPYNQKKRQNFFY